MRPFRNLPALAALALTLAFAVAGPGPARATPGQIHVVDRPAVNLRAEPGTEAEIIGRLHRGDRVMEFERRGRWLRVRPMGRVGREGWVHGGLLEPEARAPLPAEADTAEAGPPPPVVQVYIIEDGGERFIVHRSPGRKFRRHRRGGHKGGHHGGHNGGKTPETAPVDPNRPRGATPRSHMGGVGSGQWIKGGG